MSDAAAPAGDERAEPIPLSALQHAVYCLRQAALIHVERLWADNRLTAEGHVLHAAADEPGRRKVRGVRRASALPLASRRLGIAGVADLVEFRRVADRDVPFPIEMKRGKPKLHRADEVQLCAQALCLEEMTGVPVPEGALFYAETRRRLPVAFDAGLRRLTEDTIASLHDIFATLETPPPTPHKARCRSCSLHEICRPEAVARPAAAWRRRAVGRLLADPDPPA
jgi:CRISPR-associated exonuclease Cas4